MRTIRRRAITTTALLATAAALVLLVRLTMPRSDIVPSSGVTVATIARVEGGARLLRGGPGVGAVPTPLRAGGIVRAGEWVETDATARAAFRLGDGTSLRLDTGSRARLHSSAVIELTDGALYLDTGRESTSLEVRTSLGIAHDIGTQFEVRLDDSSLRLRVRTGVVELRRGDQSVSARAGTELTMASGGAVSRAVSVYGPEWEWAASVAPAFDIEGRPLAAFLDHLCREHGWALRYTDAALARDASSIILHGSVQGLRPGEALGVALTTSGLAHRLRDGELFVFRTESR